MRYSVLVRLIKYDANYETLFRGSKLSEEALKLILEKYAGNNIVIDVWQDMKEEVEDDCIN